MTPAELKALRESLGMSQFEFGLHLGDVLGPGCRRTPQAVAQWESGANIPKWMDSNIEKIKGHRT